MSLTPYYDHAGITIYHGDCLEVLPLLGGGSVRCLATSPPYWGALRSYGDSGSDALGGEREPSEYIARLVRIFDLIRPSLASDGSVWLNVGDVYAASGKGGGGIRGSRSAGWRTIAFRPGFRMPPGGYKQKDLTHVAPQLASALRADGWYHRQSVVWSKPVAVEPIRLDRPSCSHEYVSLLTKSDQYAVRDPGEAWWQRSVWEIVPDASADHPATMPYELARRAIVASTKPGDVVLDPFMGSGTTLRAAKDLGRSAIGIEIEEKYCEIAAKRLAQEVLPLP